MKYLTLIALAVCLTPPASAAAAGDEGYHELTAHAAHRRGARGFPVRLTLVSPLRADERSIQHAAGWPLAFKISARRNVTLVVPAVGGGSPSAWPEPGATSFLMLKDLDGCPSAGGQILDPLGQPACPDTPEDELWIAFTPDEDMPDVPDAQGSDELRLAMKSPFLRPIVNYKNDLPHSFGPRVHETADGLGYGANDDLPGFVLLADTGVGVVLSDLEVVEEDGVLVTRGWERPVPMQSRNLAGFMTSVAYELNDERGRTTITTRLTVPRHLTERRYLEDQCFVNDDGGCDTAHRVEGGPILPEDTVSLDEYDVTIKAFVVQGTAPSVVVDCNEDGYVGAADAVCMGYRLLSREVDATIRQIGRSDDCNRLADPWGSNAAAGRKFVDFDGNANAFTLSCPGGSTGGGSPPRQRESR
ncbi:MAG: hypothetical protein AAFX56_00445 [Pseudomonadota bacterium]